MDVKIDEICLITDLKTVLYKGKAFYDICTSVGFIECEQVYLCLCLLI